MTVEEGLRAALLDETSAGQRIGPMALPQNPTLPAIVYQRVSTSTSPSHDRGGVREPRMQLSCWGATYDEALELALEVDERLDGRRYDGVRYLLAGEYHDEDETTREGDQLGRCRVIVDYFAMHARSLP